MTDQATETLNDGGAVTLANPNNVELIASAEINQQIATAKRYPRSVTTFMREARALVTLNEAIAQQCIYALPRDGKTVEGPSARFAEVIAHAWGNSRAGARVVNEGQEFITAQGVMHDLERNVAITYEVQRRITDKHGRRYKPDMIGVTANAACSIALRNAILKAVPKAFWDPLYQEARKVVAGDVQTLANKRAAAIQQFSVFGVTKEAICAKLGRAGVPDITVDDLVTLFGILTAIKEGDTTPEQAFTADEETARPAPPQRKSAAKAQGAETAPAPASANAKPKAEQTTGSAAQEEIEFVKKKLAALGVPEKDALDAVGLSTLDGLTPDGYIALRDYIRQREAG